MAKALRTKREHRANGDLALHVLEILTSFQKSSEEEKHIHLQTTAKRPQPMDISKLTGML
jgi:hypothetical protein